MAASLTARCSTCVIPEGTPITMRGRMKDFRLCTRWMKYLSISPVMSKSEITPSLIGRIVLTSPGVRPSIRLASAPTESTLPVFAEMATTEGSLHTMPLPLTYTSVLAVPRSMAMSFENHPIIVLMNIVKKAPFEMHHQGVRHRDRRSDPSNPDHGPETP